ncbi:MAG: hypothetical protein ACP5KB_03100, partial [Thermoprotei archaeon]
AMYSLVISVIIGVVMSASLGNYSQAIHNRYSEHNKLNLRSRDDDNIHNSEPALCGVGVMRSRPGAG